MMREALANDVGRMIAQINTETLRVRTEADQDAGVLGLLPKGDIVDVVDNSNPGMGLHRLRRSRRICVCGVCNSGFPDRLR